MGTQIKNQSGSGPVKILVVSQIYRSFKGFENFDMNVLELEDLYARRIDKNGKEFEDKFKIEKFFSVKNRDFKDLKDFISSGNYGIIHFSMHAHGGRVYFTEKDLLSYDKFISAFEYIHGTEAVIFNICNSVEIAERIAAKVPLVLGWEGRVTEEKAKETSESFYTPLFNSYPVSECFTRLMEKPEPNCKIYMNSERLDDQRKPDKTPSDAYSINKNVSDNKVVSDGKKSVRKKQPAFIISLVLFLLVMSAIFFIKYGKVGSPGLESDSLRIISPVSGSKVVQNTDFILSAKLRNGGIPWIFVLPPAGKEWWPQYKGHLTDSGNWEVPVLAGNANDTGQFTMIAMVIKDQTAEEMDAWLASQGTPNQSDPLSNEIIQSFFWYASDTVIVTRIIE